MKHPLSALVLSLGLLAPALASAEEHYQKGTALFSAERLMGISLSHFSRENPDPPGGDAEADWTSFGFGWRANAAGQLSPFDVPRIGFDYMVIDHLSIGGSLGYASVSLDDPDQSAALFQIAPRVGYMHAFTRVISIWPRGGLTYHSLGTDPGSESENGLALTIECPFTFSPTDHFAFHVGPTFDIDMFGNFNPEAGDDRSQHWRTFGITGGILGWL